MALEQPETFYFFKGRVALYAILRAIGISPTDEIILPGFTCIVVPNAIKYVGATPIYVDIDPETFNIDPQKIEEKITKRTRAIIAQHTFGIPAEMDDIMATARRHNLLVIEDSCHAIGSEYKGRMVGTLGDASFFSSQWSKPVTTGLGGWAKANNAKMRQDMMTVHAEFSLPTTQESLLLRLQYLFYAGTMRPKLFWLLQGAYRNLAKMGMVIGSSSPGELECRMPNDYAKRMSGWQFRLLENKLQEIEAVIAHRRKIADLYNTVLGRRGAKTLQLSSDYSPVFLRYPLLVRDKGKALARAKRGGLEVGDWFVSPVHPNLEGWDRVNYEKGMCPIAEEVCEQVINLPTNPGVDEREAERIIEAMLDIT